MQGDQRGRARGVHGDRRALQTEGVGHPARGDAAGSAGAEVPRDLLGDGGQPGDVVVVHHAREDARTAALDRGRVDPGPLERLPGRLQQQSLLRVHRQRLARVDAEEGRVEGAGVVQEAALKRRACPLGVGAVQRVHQPAAIGGEAGDAVTGLGDQLPQLLGRVHAAGVAAGHADDRDRVVGDARGDGQGGRGDGGLRGAMELGAQLLRQSRRVGVVEDQRGGQSQTGRRVQAVAQLDGGQRVEAELLEGQVRLDGVGVGVTEHGGHLAGDQGQQRLAPLGLRQRGQLAPERVAARLGLGGASGRSPDQAAQQGRQRGARGLGPQARQVQADRDVARAAQRDGGVEQGQALLAGERGDAAARHPLEIGLLQRAGHAAAFGPQTPGQRGGRQPGRPAVVREGVQEGVGGGVVGLAGSAEGGSCRREEHERGQVQIPRQLVQVPGGVHLGAQHRSQALGGERGDDAVVQHARGVHHGAERVLQRAEQPGQRVAVGDVAGRERHLGARLGQFGDECGRTGGLDAAPGDQQQAAHSVLGDQVTGDQRAQGAGRAGDQHGPVRVEQRCRVDGGGGHPGQSGHSDGARAQCELRLLGGHGIRQGPERSLFVVEVEQDEPARVLHLGRADQTPDGGGGQVRDGLARVDGHRATGDQHQAGVGQPVGGQPLLDQSERAAGRRVRGGGQLARLGPDDRQHGVGQRAAGRDGAVQRGQVGVPGQVEAEPLRAEQRPPRGFGGADGGGLPLHGEQGLVVRAARGLHLGGRDRPQQQRVDPGDGRAGAVRDGDRDAVLARRGEPHPQGVGAGGVQGDPAPGEREPTGLAGAQQGAHADAVQGGVEQRGVQAEQAGVSLGLLGQPDLRVDLVARLPGGAQALEDRAVAETGLGQVRVESLGLDRGGVGRGPAVQAEGLGPVLGGGGREDAGGVPGPGVFGGQGRAARGVLRLRARVQGEAAAAGGVRLPHRELELDRAVLGQDQRGLQGQFGELVAAHVVARADGELDEGRPGQQHGAHHHVVGEPGMGLQRELAGEEHAVGVGERDRRAEQRVVGRAEADRRDVAEPAGRGLGPVTAALEGVGGQVHPGSAPARGDGAPVGRGAVGVGPGERGEQGPVLGATGAQGGHQGGGLGVVAQAVLRHGGEDAVGAELQVGGDAVGVEPTDGVEEADGLADVAHPVLGRADLLGGQRGAGHGGDDRDARRLVVQALGDPAELGQHAVHQRGVEGVAHCQALGLAPQLLEVPCHGQDVVLGAGDHHGGRTVDGGDAHRVRTVRQQRQHLLLRRLQGHHRATGGQLLHQAAAGRDQRTGVGERQHARDVGGGQLADGVPGQEVRSQAPRLDQPEQRHLHGEERGLRVAGLVQQADLAGGAEDHVLQRAVQVPVQLRADRVERLGEDRERRVGLGAHPGPLTALAGEEERGAALGGRDALHQVRRALAVGERVQAREQLGAVGGQDGGAVVQGGAGGGQRVGEVGGGELGSGVQVVAESGGLGAQRLCGPPGDQEGQQRGGGHRRGPVGGLLGLGGLLDDGVRVGAADAEGRDARAARLAGLRPRPGLLQQGDAAGGPVDVRRGLVHVQGLGQHAVLHREHHLDDARDTGGRLGVAEVRLDRPEPQRPVLGALQAVGGQQGLRLDRVAEHRAGAVRLDDVDLARRQTGSGQRLPDDPLLGRAVGRGESVAGAVLVDRRTADHREHRVTVALRVAQPLQQQHADALAPAGAVGRRGEGLAAAVGREPALAAELDEGPGAGHHRDAAGERQRALPLAQRLHREVQRDQRGRAGRVDGDGRALQSEGVGEPAGEHARRVAGERVALDALGHLVEQVAVVLAVGPGEDAGPAALEGGRVDARALQHLPGRLQQQALLRVHAERLTGADAEEGGVELRGVVEEPAASGVAGALLVGVVVEERRHVPAAVGREVADRVASLGHQLPEVLGRVHPAGEPAAHGDQGDRLGVARLRVTKPLAGLVQIRRHALQIVEQLVLIHCGNLTQFVHC